MNLGAGIAGGNLKSCAGWVANPYPVRHVIPGIPSANFRLLPLRVAAAQDLKI